MKYALFLCLLTGGSVFASHDLSRYEVIMERAPFGNEPPPSEAAQPAAPAGEFAKQYRLCMLYEDAQGQLKAGIVSKTNNKNFFLQIGQSEENLELVEVRLEEGLAILRQGGELAQMMLEGLGTPMIPFSQRESVVAAVPPSGSGIITQVRRSGPAPGAAHILAALTDAAPKQARITVRKTNPVPPPEDTAVGSSGSGQGTFRGILGKPKPISALGQSKTKSPPETLASPKPASAPAPSGGNYLVQSVPKRYSPF